VSPARRRSADYCAASPCANGGQCSNEFADDDYVCACVDGWTGKRCALVDHCAAHACMNEGVCRNTATGYECACDGEWAGRFCEHACPSALCSNGGTCDINAFGNDYMCVCAPGTSATSSRARRRRLDGQTVPDGD